MRSRQCARYARGVLWAVLLYCLLLAGTAGARTPTEPPRLAQPEQVLLSPAGARVTIAEDVAVYRTAQGGLVRLFLPGAADEVAPDVPGQQVLRWSLRPLALPAEGQAARERQRLLDEADRLDGRLVALDTALALYRLPARDAAPLPAAALKDAGRQILEDVAALGQERAFVERRLKQLRDMLAARPALPDQGQLLEILLADVPGTPVRVTCSYSLEHCGWRPRYSLDAQPATGTIMAHMLADVWQYSGQDWTTCRLSLISSPTGALRPAALPSWDIAERPAARSKTAEAMLAAPRVMQLRETSSQINAVESGAFVRWDVPAAGLPQGRFTLSVAQENWHAPLSWLARPVAGEGRVWMTARHAFTKGASWPGGLMECRIDGQSVGTGLFAPENGEVQLFFGADPQVHVTVDHESRRRGESGIIKARRLWHWNWTYTLRNERQNAVDVRVERPLPRAVEESVQVTMQNAPDASVDRDGRTLYWTIRVPARQTATVRHGVSLSAPADLPLEPVAP